MFEDTIRLLPRPKELERMTTAELREAFLVDGFMVRGQLRAVFTNLDRLVIGGAVPTDKPLPLENCRATGRTYFLEQRELGAINIGGQGLVHADGKTFVADHLACVYVGAGTRQLVFESKDAANPAKFYFLSCPAHASYPSGVMSHAEADAVTIGAAATASLRTIRRFIHPNGIRSCQLVMGYTELAEGSVWNTFPPHTHNRRSEVYFYFDLADRLVVHFLGLPTATRHLFVRNEQAVLSPIWSIHSACGFGQYKFIWGMAGENQTFEDMDSVNLTELQ
ncbi:MAG: 5-dehydro-4-deoxy-D-glucuronate isomerase [Verrucomicrobiae bacterium]|nr:5-dehydro-4-deoxy-D-glucuronate isomerase [Verrucomicrobiae bacterium]